MKLDGKKNKSEQLNWLVTQRRPDIFFRCCDLPEKIKSPNIDAPKRANKLINKIKK